jgi:hypothetical protein
MDLDDLRVIMDSWQVSICILGLRIGDGISVPYAYIRVYLAFVLMIRSIGALTCQFGPKLCPI